MEAKYKCLKCGKEWYQEPRPTQCPWCGHLFVEWTNFDEMREYWKENVEGYKKYC